LLLLVRLPVVLFPIAASPELFVAVKLSCVELPSDAEELDAEELDSEELDTAELETEEFETEEFDAEELDAEELDAEELDAEELDAEELEVMFSTSDEFPFNTLLLLELLPLLSSLPLLVLLPSDTLLLLLLFNPPAVALDVVLSALGVLPSEELMLFEVVVLASLFSLLLLLLVSVSFSPLLDLGMLAVPGSRRPCRGNPLLFLPEDEDEDEDEDGDDDVSRDVTSELEL